MIIWMGMSNGKNSWHNGIFHTQDDIANDRDFYNEMVYYHQQFVN